MAKLALQVGNPLRLNDADGHYLAGIADGEGHFGIGPRNVNSYYCLFLIHLRADDRDLLDALREATGLGSIYIGRRHKQGSQQPSWRWAVQKRNECLRLVEIFEAYPLRSRKRYQFEVWAEAVRAWEHGDWDEMRVAAEHLVALRMYSTEEATRRA